MEITYVWRVAKDTKEFVLYRTVDPKSKFDKFLREDVIDTMFKIRPTFDYLGISVSVVRDSRPIKVAREDDEMEAFGLIGNRCEFHVEFPLEISPSQLPERELKIGATVALKQQPLVSKTTSYLAAYTVPHTPNDMMKHSASTSSAEPIVKTQNVLPVERPPSNTSAITSSVKRDKNAPCQFKNLGNTCYMNASLQAVLAIPVFVEKVMAYQSTDESPTILSMIAGLHKAEGLADAKSRLEAIKTKCGEKNNQFKGYTQNDAHEFVRVLLGLLHDQTNKAPQRPVPSAPINATEAWEHHLNLDNSLVYDVFAGQEKSALTCSGCEKVSVTWTTTLELVLALPSTDKECKGELPCLVHGYSSEAGTTIKCEGCQNQERDAKKVVTMLRWPKVLCISLSRFASPTCKNGVAVEVKEMLFVADDAVYQLCSAVVHIGSGIEGGHYVSYVKKTLSDGGEKWFYCSDDDIQEVSEVESKLKGAYLLFYTRVD